MYGYVHNKQLYFTLKIPRQSYLDGDNIIRTFLSHPIIIYFSKQESKCDYLSTETACKGKVPIPNAEFEFIIGPRYNVLM